MPPAEPGPRRAGGMDPDKLREPTPFLERRMPSSPFPAIADYAFLSDCHTGALVAPDGTVEWLCLPRFDSPSVFAALLDRGAGGCRLGPSEHRASRSAAATSRARTSLETTWMTPTGWLVVRDALIIGRWRSRERPRRRAHTRPPSDYESDHLLVRTLAASTARSSLEHGLRAALRLRRGRRPGAGPGAEHGSPTPATARRRCGCTATSTSGSRAAAPAPAAASTPGEGASARSRGREARRPATARGGRGALDRPTRFWRAWLAAGDFPDHPWRVHLQRSALVLKGLTYAPTGAMVAAPTTSLPETPGGERNWDYRYTWMRDATFTLWACTRSG